MYVKCLIGDRDSLERWLSSLAVSSCCCCFLCFLYAIYIFIHSLPPTSSSPPFLTKLPPFGKGLQLLSKTDRKVKPFFF